MKRHLPLITFILLIACSQPEKPVPAGDTNHGRQLIEQYGCTTCHVIPGIEGPKGMAGPSLNHLATRPVIAGKIPNTPPNVIAYLQNPQASNPENAMPNLGITPPEAKDIAAYLSTLK